MAEINIEIGVVTYGLSALAYVVLSVLLLTSWRGRLQGALLLVACLVASVWSLMMMYHAALGYPQSDLVFVVELVRDLAWIVFLVRLLSPKASDTFDWQLSSGVRVPFYTVLSLTGVLIVAHLVAWTHGGSLESVLSFDPRFIGHVLVVIIALALVEQIFRNTRPEQRWAIKYLCLGIGGMFAYDFFLYSDALLLRHLDGRLWEARGLIQVFAVPLIAVAAARNPQWSLDVFVSRRVVFHTAALMATGAYLLAMAAGGYLIRYYGGNWGGIGQVIFLFGAGFVLLILLFSGHIRARFKVFLSKHFFSYKYDYRDEWLNLIAALTTEDVGSGNLRQRVVQVLATMVDSTGGCLWLKDEHGRYEQTGLWNVPDQHSVVTADDPVVRFMIERDWLINLAEYQTNPELYGELQLPVWLADVPRAWLIIPLLQRGELLGFVLLTASRAARPINWEDRDLLKTAARQAASYLALAEASTALASARQFEAFNRLSAYLVHDLKNVVGQLSLVTANAKKFSHNPEFVADAMATVENSVTKMQKMLAQLRQGRPSALAATAIKLAPVLEEVVRHRSGNRPTPRLEIEGQGLSVVADRDRLAAVIEHVIQNAQEATPAEGWVRVGLKPKTGEALIEIEDNGCGMDAEFVRERLFRPFDTTKGNAGMGIGAYECREFILGLGGRVEVKSQPGIGTLFQITIPLSSSGSVATGEVSP